MFLDCSSLSSLDVSNFDTSNVTDMRSMFRNCRSLTSLDLSNFNTSRSVEYMSDMFKYTGKTESPLVITVMADKWTSSTDAVNESDEDGVTNYKFVVIE